MVSKQDSNKARLRRHKRVRGKISGTAERPRLNVFRSNANIYAQVIDDTTGTTLCAASTLDKSFNGNGGNKEAALMSGVNVKSNSMWGFVFCGIGMAITALVLTSRMGSAHVTAADSYQMQAIATVYLGATAFKEGEPNLAGTLLGALILGVLKNGMTLMNISYYYQDIAQGVVILLAVIITSLQRNRKK